MVDEDDVDRRHVAELHDGIAVPVQILDTGGVEVDLLHQRPAASLNDVAFNLIPHAVTVDDDAAVVRDGDRVDRHLSRRPIHLYVRDLCHDGACQSGDGDAASFGNRGPCCGRRPGTCGG